MTQSNGMRRFIMRVATAATAVMLLGVSNPVLPPATSQEGASEATAPALLGNDSTPHTTADEVTPEPATAIPNVDNGQPDTTFPDGSTILRDQPIDPQDRGHEPTMDLSVPALSEETKVENPASTEASDAPATVTTTPRRVRRAADLSANYSYDYYPETQPAAQPVLPKRCGLNIALVFDMSTSIGDSGLASSKKAANDVIDALYGTPTNISIFDFAGSAPAWSFEDDYDAADFGKTYSLLSETEKAAAKNAVSDLQLPGRYASGQGGTNWEGALDQVNRAQSQVGATHYDLVYFITDGVPTTNDSRTGEDYGTVTHAADLERAIQAANELKRNKTYIQPIMVNVPDRREMIFQDRVVSGYRLGWSSAEIYSRGGYYYGQNSDGSLYVTRVNYGYYNGGDGYTYYGYYEQYKYNGSNNTLYNGHNDIYSWYAGGRTPKAMLADISSVDAADPSKASVSSYDELARKLRLDSIRDCRGSVNIVKMIVPEDGDETQAVPGVGWEFTVSADAAAVGVLDEDNNPKTLNGEWVLDKTSKGTTRSPDGAVSFPISAEKDVPVTVAETPQDRYQLKPRENGAAAKCIDATEAETKELPVENLLDADGNIKSFKVTNKYQSMEIFGADAIYRPGIVTCHVYNQRVNPAEAIVRKEPRPGALVDVNPDGTATLEYTIVETNGADKISEKTELIDQFQLPKNVIANGDVTISWQDKNGNVLSDEHLNKWTKGAVKTVKLNKDSKEDDDAVVFSEGDTPTAQEVRLAEWVSLPAKTSLYVKVSIPIKVVNVDTDNWDATWTRLGKCEGTGEVVSRYGVPNSVKKLYDVADESDNHACIPLRAPKQLRLGVKKFGVDRTDTESETLTGSRFALYAETDGAIDWNKRVGEVEGSTQNFIDLLSGNYYLVEEKAPFGYQLLAKPVKILIQAQRDGYVAALGDEADKALITISTNPTFQLYVNVADVMSGELPKTGGQGLWKWGLFGVMMLTAAVVARRKLT